MPAGRQQQPALRALPAIFIAASFALGIGAAMLLDGLVTGYVYTIGIVAALAGLAATLVKPLRKAGLLIIIGAAGLIDYTMNTLPVDIPSGEYEYSGLVEQTLDSDARQLVIMKIDRVDGKRIRPFKARLSMDQSNDNVEAGYRLTLYTTLEPLSDTPSMPDEITYYALMKREGIGATAFVTPETHLSVNPADGFSPLMSRIRNHVTDIVYRTSLSADSKIFLATALLGRGDVLPSETREAFARAGLSHILALSGMHLAIIAGLFYWLLAPLLIFCTRHVRSIIILVMIWGYAFLTGLGAPVVRAAIMTSLVLCADLLQRRTFALNSLMFAALVILVFSPSQLGEIGFQLSFLAVAAIILFSDNLNPASESRNTFLRAVGGTVSMSMAAMLATGLLSALWFHSLPLLFLVANIIVGPIVVPLILGGGIAVIIGAASGIQYGIFVKAVDWGVDILQSTANVVASCPWASVEVWDLSGITVFLVIATLTVIGLRLRRPESSRRLIGLASVLAVCAIVSAFTMGRTETRDPKGTWYRLKSSDAFDLIVPIDDTIFFVSDAPLSTLSTRAETIGQRLKEYMGRRNMKRVIAVGEQLVEEGLIKNKGRMLIGNLNVVIADNGYIPAETVVSPTDILIVARGYNGNLDTAVETLRPTKIYLSPALNPKLRKQYASRLESMGIDYEL